MNSVSVILLLENMKILIYVIIYFLQNNDLEYRDRFDIFMLFL